ncbi:MAG: DUF1844 domain-containing protein [Myxococcota bacterium]
MPPATQQPPVTFSTFLISLASSGLQHLGQNERDAQDLHLARQTLELLGVLEEKTRNNLDAEEQKLLHAVRDELQQKYSEALRATV